MFDIGFWELLVIAVVLLLVMGPERLPEVARQAAFLLRKARQGMFRIRNEMRSELEGTPFEDLENAKREMSEFKNDIKQLGRDLADSAGKTIDAEKSTDPQHPQNPTTTQQSSARQSAQKSMTANDKSSSLDEAEG